MLLLRAGALPEGPRAAQVASAQTIEVNVGYSESDIVGIGVLLLSESLTPRKLRTLGALQRSNS